MRACTLPVEPCRRACTLSIRNVQNFDIWSGNVPGPKAPFHVFKEQFWNQPKYRVHFLRNIAAATGNTATALV